MECGIGTLYALGNQPEVATRAGGLGNVQGGADVPFCAGRLLFSGVPRISALSSLFTRPREQCGVLSNALRGWTQRGLVLFCSVLATARRAPTSLSRHTR